MLGLKASDSKKEPKPLSADAWASQQKRGSVLECTFGFRNQGTKKTVNVISPNATSTDDLGTCGTPVMPVAPVVQTPTLSEDSPKSEVPMKRVSSGPRSGTPPFRTSRSGTPPPRTSRSGTPPPKRASLQDPNADEPFEKRGSRGSKGSASKESEGSGKRASFSDDVEPSFIPQSFEKRGSRERIPTPPPEIKEAIEFPAPSKTSLASSDPDSELEARLNQASKAAEQGRRSTYRDVQQAAIKEELEKAKEKSFKKNKSLFSVATRATLHFRDEDWIDSTKANTFFGAVILANSIYAGVEVDLADRSVSDFEEPWWFAIESGFLLIFIVELVLRVKAHRMGVLRDYWNIFDIVLIVLGVADTWILTLIHLQGQNDGANMSSMTLLRVLRIFRLLRVLRVLRLFRFFRELLLLAQGIFGAMRALFWAVALIVLVLYICAVFINRLLENQDDVPERHQEQVDLWFGTVGRTFFTLFQMMSLENWPIIARSCMEFNSILWLFFVPFVALTQYMLLNLVTAVVVENVLVISQKEQLAEVKREEQVRLKTMKQLKALFEEMDDDGNGELTIEEFHTAMEDEGVIQQFAKMEIAHYEALELFELLDIDRDGSITVSEFVEGVLRVRGSAKAKHLLAVQYDLQKFWNDMCGVLDELLDNLTDEEERLKDKRDALKRKQIGSQIQNLIQPVPVVTAHEDGETNGIKRTSITIPVIAGLRKSTKDSETSSLTSRDMDTEPPSPAKPPPGKPPTLASSAVPVKDDDAPKRRISEEYEKPSLSPGSVSRSEQSLSPTASSGELGIGRRNSQNSSNSNSRRNSGDVGTSSRRNSGETGNNALSLPLQKLAERRLSVSSNLSGLPGQKASKGNGSSAMLDLRSELEGTFARLEACCKSITASQTRTKDVIRSGLASCTTEVTMALGTVEAKTP